jgi:hypothetical protein
LATLGIWTRSLELLPAPVPNERGGRDRVPTLTSYVDLHLFILTIALALKRRLLELIGKLAAWQRDSLVMVASRRRYQYPSRTAC